jgi:transposase
MLADELEYVVGVDTHRDRHTLAVVAAPNGGVVAQRSVRTNARGYADAVRFAEKHAPGARLWAVEGAGHYGAGLARHLSSRGETVIESGRGSRDERRLRGKDDPLDAIRAARAALASETLSLPRSGKRREALRLLLLARRSAIEVRRRALVQLRSVLVTAPDRLRAELQALPEEAGVGPIVAADVIVAWSHHGRVRTEAAFARLAGVAPVPASSGQTVRHRLSRGGDRQLNRALHTIALHRRQHDPATKFYIERRVAEGKSRREATRLLKRYLARRIYRLLQHQPIMT